MKKIMIILAALLLAGCGKVDDLSHREGAESIASATSPTSVTTAAAAGETSAETSAADSAQETSAKRSDKKKTTTTTTAAAQKASDTAEAVSEAVSSTPLADTDTVPETEPPRETFATPTVLPPDKPDDSTEQKVPDFYPEIFQPAHFVSQTFSANWETLEVMSGGSPAVIRSADELRAYMEPVFPEDFIRERLDFFTTRLLGGENFFDDNVLLVNTLPQGSGTEPMLRIDRCDPSDSMINIKYSWLYEDGCAYPEVMSVCLLQVTAGRDWLGSKSVEWSLSPKTQGE